MSTSNLGSNKALQDEKKKLAQLAQEQESYEATRQEEKLSDTSSLEYKVQQWKQQIANGQASPHITTKQKADRSTFSTLTKPSTLSGTLDKLTGSVPLGTANSPAGKIAAKAKASTGTTVDTRGTGASGLAYDLAQGTAGNATTLYSSPSSAYWKQKIDQAEEESSYYNALSNYLGQANKAGVNTSALRDQSQAETSARLNYQKAQAREQTTAADGRTPDKIAKDDFDVDSVEQLYTYYRQLEQYRDKIQSQLDNVDMEKRDQQEREIEQLETQIAKAKSVYSDYWRYNNQSQYTSLVNNADFAEKSTGGQDYAKLYFSQHDKLNYQYATDQEKAIFNYVYRTQGADAAEDYYKGLKYTLDERRTEKVNETATNIANKHPVLGTLSTFATNVTSGTGLVDAWVQYAQGGGWLTGDNGIPMNLNTRAFDASNYSNTMRGTVSENLNAKGTISDNIPVIGGKGLGDLYQMGTSTVDSAINAGLVALGIPEGVSLAMMGTSAGTAAITDAKSRGASDEQALAYGTFSAIFEAMFEKVSLDNLIKPSNVGNLKQVLKETAKQSGIEGSEEMFTTMANILVSGNTIGAYSDYNQLVQQYISLGYSEDEAKAKASWQSVQDVLFDGVAGAISSLPMGGVRYSGSLAYNAKTGKNFTGTKTELLQAASQQTYEGQATPAAELAQAMLSGTEADSTANLGQVARLYQIYGGDLSTYTNNFDEVSAKPQETTAEPTATQETQESQQEAVTYRQEEEAAEEAQEAQEAEEAEEEAEADNATDEEKYYKVAERVTGQSRAELESNIAQEQQISDRIQQVREAIETGAETASEIKNALKESGLTGGEAESALTMAKARQAVTTSLVEGRYTYETTDSWEPFSMDYTQVEDEDGNTVSVAEEYAKLSGKKTTAKKAATAVKAATVTAETANTDISGKVVGVTVEDGKTLVRVKSSDGTVHAVEASTVNMSQGMETLVEETAKLGKYSSVAFAAYNRGQNIQEYTSQFQTAAEFAENGVSLSALKGLKSLDALTDAQKEIAYEQGRENRQEARKRDKKSGKRKSSGNVKVLKETTTVRDKSTTIELHGVDESHMDEEHKSDFSAMKTLARAISNATGLDIVFYETQADEEGTYQGANGFYLNDTLYIDVNAMMNQVGDGSKNMMVYTMSHELTHYLKDAAPTEFAALQEFVVNNLEGEDLDTLVSMKQTINENLSYEEAIEEVVADGCEEMLTRSEAVQDLIQQEPGLAEKLRAWIKDFVARVKEALGRTGHSLEARALSSHMDEVTKLWDNAFKAATEAENGQKNNAQKGVAKFSERVVNGKTYVWIENDELTKKQLNNPKFMAEYLADHIGECYTIIENGKKVYLGKDFPGEYAYSKYTTYLRDNNRNLYRAKNRAASELGLLIETATNERLEATRHADNKDAKLGMYRYDCSFAIPAKDEFGNIQRVNAYNAELIIRFASDGKRYLYDILNVKKDSTNASDLLKQEAGSVSLSAATRRTVVNDNVAQPNEKSKTKFSTRDSQGRKLSQGQQEYFRDSKVVDEKGRLRVMFHQTGNDFTVFDPTKTGAGAEDSETPSGIFMKPTAGDIGLRGKKQMVMYANITNPLEVQNREAFAQWSRENIPGYREAENKIEAISKQYEAEYQEAEERSDNWYAENYDALVAGTITEEEAEQAITGELDEILGRWKKEEGAARKAAKNLLDRYFSGSEYDGVHLAEDAGSMGRSVETYIAFSPEQVKDVTNTTPTENPDIRYSTRVSERDLRNLAEKLGGEQYKYTGVQKMQKALTEYYHATIPALELQSDIREFAQDVRTDTEAEDYSERITNHALELGRKIAESATETYTDDLYSEISSHLKNTKVKIDAQDRTDIYAAVGAENWNQFRSIVGKYMTFDQKNGMSVDDLYTSLQGTFGDGLFPDQTNMQSQMEQILSVLEGYSPQEVALFNTEEELDEIATTIASTLISANWDTVEIGGKTVQLKRIETTLTQRLDERLKQVQAEADARIEEARAENEKRVAELKAKQEQALRDERRQNAKQLREQKEAAAKAAKEAKAENAEKLKAATQTAKDAATRTTQISARRALASQLKRKGITEISANPAVQDWLTRWNDYYNQYNDARRNLADQRAIMNDKTESRDARTEAKNRAEILKTQMERLDKQMKQYEQNSLMSQAIRESIMEVERTTKAQIKEKRDARTAQEKLLKLAKRLNAKNLPQMTKSQITALIGDIDLTSIGITNKTIENLQSLRQWYEGKKAELGSDFYGIPSVEKSLSRLDKTHISDLTQEQIANLLLQLSSIENSLRNQDRMLNQEEKRTVTELGEATLKGLKKVKGITPTKLNAVSRMVNDKALAPVKYVHRLTGYQENSPLYQAFQRINDGQRDMLAYENNAMRQFVKFTDDDKFMKTFRGKNATEIEITGIEQGTGEEVKVKITPDMRAALYLHSMNNDNMRHISYGGITIPDVKLYKQGNVSEAYTRGTTIKLERSQINRICEGMTEQEKAFANAAYRYFNRTSKEALNKVSLQLMGYELAQVENYFPINTNRDFLSADPTQLKMDALVENLGFTKQRVQASNPIYLRSLTTVLSENISKHSKYVGLTMPIRDFMKLYNYNSFEYSNSVKSQLGKKWGKSGTEYINQVLTDLQSGKVSGGDLDSLFDQLRSNYAASVLSLNLSVAMKQAASYPTAAAVLGFSPLAKASAELARNVGSSVVGGKHINGIIETSSKYTPLLEYRARGYSTTELGDLASRDSGIAKILAKPALNWIQDIDLATTATLWKASEYYVQDNNKGLAKGSEEYYKAVADIYNRVIEETQPNYTAMQRGQMLRSDSFLDKVFGMFKTQPFQNYSILYDGIMNYAAKVEQFKAGEISQTELKQAAKDARNAVVSQVVQLVTFSSMTLAASMILGKGDRYKEDNDELTVQSFLQRFLLDTGSGIAGMVPFAGEIFSGITNMIEGNSYDLVSAVQLDAINDMWSALTTAYGGIADILAPAEEGEEKRRNWHDLLKSLEGAAKSAAEVVGIPASNLVTIVNRLMYEGVKAFGGSEGIYEYTKLTTKYSDTTTYYGVLYDILASDPDGYADIAAELAEKGDFTADKIQNKMKTYLGEDFIEGDFDEGELYDKLEAIGLDDDTIVDTIAGFKIQRDFGFKESEAQDKYITGEIGDADALKILTEYMGKSQDSAEDTLQNWKVKRDFGLSVNDVKEGYVSGALSREQTLTILTDYKGNTEEAAEEKLMGYDILKDYGIESDEVDDAYISGDLTADEATDILVNYKGKSEEDAAAQIAKWDMTKETGYSDQADVQEALVNGEITQDKATEILTNAGYKNAESTVKTWAYEAEHSDLVEAGITRTQYEEYLTSGEPYGVTLNDFVDAKTYYNSLEGEEKQSYMITYINSMNTTSAEKDAMWNVFGWSTNTKTYRNLPWH